MPVRYLRSSGLIAIAAGVALVLLPFVFGAHETLMNQLVLATAYVVMALGLNVVVGFAGLLDLGYVAFYAIGAHVAAHLGSAFWDKAGGGRGVAVLVERPAASLPGIHFNFLLVLVAVVVVTMVAGVLIGLPTLRVSGAYVGVITLAFGEIIGQLVYNGREITFLGGSLTGGPAGMAAVDGIDLPFLPAFTPLDLRPWYWFGLALVALTLVTTQRLRDSRVGRAWAALRDDEDAAAAAGVPVVRFKLTAYAVGGAFGGIAGAFLASYSGSVNPSEFSFSFSILILAMVVVGGIGSLSGAVIGALLLSAVNNYLLPQALPHLPHELGLDFDLTQIAPGLYGFLLVLVMLTAPGGLYPALRRGTRGRESTVRRTNVDTPPEHAPHAAGARP